MTILGTYVDRGVKYTFVSSRRCREQDRWERIKGLHGVKPFGAATADYRAIKVRLCHECPEWTRGAFGRWAARDYKVYVCRCQQCAHPPFKIEEWVASERGVKFMQSNQDHLTQAASTALAHRKNSTQFDDLAEVLRIAVDFMDSGAFEDAKHALTDKLARLETDGLIAEESNDQTRTK